MPYGAEMRARSPGAEHMPESAAGDPPGMPLTCTGRGVVHASLCQPCMWLTSCAAMLLLGGRLHLCVRKLTCSLSRRCRLHCHVMLAGSSTGRCRINVNPTG
jgi:hypothetical protein